MVSLRHNADWFEHDGPNRMKERADIAKGVKKQSDMHIVLPSSTINIPIRTKVVHALNTAGDSINVPTTLKCGEVDIPLLHFDALMEELGQRADKKNPVPVLPSEMEYVKSWIVRTLKKITNLLGAFFC